MGINYFENLSSRPITFDDDGQSFFFNDFNIISKYKLFLKNGYLARENKLTGKITFFHRLFFLKMKGLLGSYEIVDMEIHHKNENKLDNRLKNLVLMSKKEHRNLHSSNRWSRGFVTWSEKTGNDNPNDFDDWLAKKEDEGECGDDGVEEDDSYYY